MKTLKQFLLTCMAVLLCTTMYAQVPQKFNYQAVARNNNNIIANAPVGVRFSIRDGQSGTILYQEVQGPTTNEFGIFSVVIGTGAVFVGNFNSIDWKSGNKWLQVEMDPTGGTSYTDMGTSELVSVPYALHTPGGWIENGNDIGNPNSGNVGIGTTSPGCKLDLRNSPLGFSTDNKRWEVAYDSTDAYLYFDEYGSARRMVIKDGGNVGIGTTNPLNNLDIVNSSGAVSALINGNTDANLYVTSGSGNPNVFFSKGGLPAGSIGYDPTASSMVVGGGFAGIGLQVLSQNVGVSDNFASHPVTSSDALFTVKGFGGYAGNHVALFENTGLANADGIAIKIDNPTTDRENNFVTFLNASGSVKGRIEGFNASTDWVPPPPTLPFDPLSVQINMQPWQNWITFPGISSTPATIGLNCANWPGTTTQSSVCDPLNHCLCIPDGVSISSSNFSLTNSSVNLANMFYDPPVSVTSPVAGSAFDDSLHNLICWGVESGINNVLLSFSPYDLALNSLKETAIQACQDGGVTYGSHGADYAEYIEKADHDSYIQAFDVVGIRGGKASRNTEGAEQIMIVSSKPVVLGNTPKEGEEKNYVTCGFMGQLPCVVRGLCHKGDYVLASNLNDGTAIAIAPENLTIDMLPRIVGRAWDEQTNDIYGLVNVAIGLKTNEWVSIFKNQEKKMDQLSADVDMLKAAIGIKNVNPGSNPSASINK